LMTAEPEDILEKMSFVLAPSSSRIRKTFRPKKSTPSGNKGMQLRRHIDNTLGQAVDFFNNVNILYSTLMEVCTPTTCPTMSGGPIYEYRWADGVKIKRPITVSAPKYVEYLMDWIEAQLDDAAIFPQQFGAPFPPNFRAVIKTIMKRLFRVYAHIYHSHFQMILELKEEAHLNTCFKHFTLFTLVILHLPEIALSSTPFFTFSIVMHHSARIPADRQDRAGSPE
ncbi:MOB kinase activator-like 1A, partial [Dichanthelium oligosanthes]